jgi:signal transduction histidine kinase
MTPAIRENLQAFGRFLRTPTLSRSVVGLLSLAIVLLLIVNLATFFMIRRTAEFNNTVEQTQAIRLTGKDLLTLLVDAETGQRGFLLTGRPEYLQVHTQAMERLPSVFAEFERLTADDPDIRPRVENIRALSDQRLGYMRSAIALARSGRIGEAVQIIRGGQGKVLMDAMRAEIAAIDEIEATRLQFRTRRSEWGAGATLAVNALAGFLILVLAGVSAWLIRRYIAEVQAARDELDQVNLGLEDKVRERTFALTRANEEIQRFAYIVSHDLRAPLVNVMGYTSELEQAGRTLDRQIASLEKARPALVDPEAVTAVREDVPEAIGFIRASTTKMDRLINAILKLAREGRRQPVAEPLDMTAIVRAIADTVSHQTGAAEAEIRIETLPWIESDRLAIEQIFGNLIDNALKYLDAGRPGRIVVTGEERAGGWVVYSVADNGRGVSDKDNERIFELFRRAGRQDRPGEGLGLAFVRNSMRRLGGTIELESTLGEGSTFRLKFPKRLVLIEAGDTP